VEEIEMRPNSQVVLVPGSERGALVGVAAELAAADEAAQRRVRAARDEWTAVHSGAAS
jgi:hypothetical protein